MNSHLFLQILATVLVVVNAQWMFRGMTAKHPNKESANAAIAMLDLAIILTALWWTGA
jgi:hypothetical protein